MKIITCSIQLGVILSEEPEINWWGQTLEALQQREEKGAQLVQNQLKELNQNVDYQPPIQIAFSTNKAQEELNNWYPWRLIQSLVGHSLTPIVKGLALTFEPDSTKAENSINLRASIQFS